MAYLQSRKEGLRASDLPEPSNRAVSNALAELSKIDEVFRYPVSNRYGLQAIMGEVFPQAKYLGDDTRPDERRESGADQRTAFSIVDRSGKEKIFYVYERGGPRNLKVFIDVSRLSEGDSGAAIYSAVGNYAHNNGGTFIGDPAGLSESATIRRTSAMLSLALRFGKTGFVEPSKSQLAGNPEKGIAPLEWKGDDVVKVSSLIKSFLSTLHGKYPTITEARYDFGTGQFLDRMGRPLRRDDPRFDKAGGTSMAREARAGEATLRRGIFLQSLVSGEGGQGPELLANLLRGNDQLTKVNLKGLFSSSLPEPQSTGDTFKKRVPVSKPLVDEARRQQEAFGKNVSSGKLANFGTEQGRKD